MGVDWHEWLNLAIRWLHLTAGIAWIGSSFYFVWLDNHLKPPAQGDASGEVWSVHGGGFYHNQKYQVAPSQMPSDLHWFKWEAYWTWISGFSLLVLVYYVGAQSFLIDPAKAALSPAEGIAIGLASIGVGWLVYDLLCRSSLGANNQILGICWFLCLVLAAYALNSVFTARGAYLHIGAIIGSVMVGNVFFVIIPKQKKVVADLIAGGTPDPALGKAAKQRSLHNNYMTLPVLFIMISHHYPMTYGAQRPWLVLALLGLTGVAIRHVFNLRGRGQPAGRTMVLAAALALISVTYVSLDKSRVLAPANAATYAQIAPIVAKHCADCHSASPSHPEFPTPPLGVVLESYEQVSAASARIKAVAVDSEIMPLGNITGMTEAERQQLGGWIDAGNPR
ncbi:urate hydroxylase PuuD [Sphingomonas sp. M1-B02]|uniref:urate hydroxylase PuuD n=1 Tax=Sphingomonas sp. M1-B02 TaxID=3114300 RepID=UPI00223FE395|nr:urate hydroxylase PuuD [Sphingomonas sp. S6-11]UZK66449.1 urate hydroxylase PuuD [Sphingomonas sp. S6-11]